MAVSNRPLRVGALLKRELAEILRRPPAEFGEHFFTVTEVRMNHDLRYAKVWVSVLGTPDQRTFALNALRESAPVLRKMLSRSVRLRRIPELHFELDETLDIAERIDHILREEGLLGD